MKKFKELLSKPITWGGYLKLCVISVILSIITSVGYYLYFTKDYRKTSCDYNSFTKNEDSTEE